MASLTGRLPSTSVQQSFLGRRRFAAAEQDAWQFIHESLHAGTGILLGRDSGLLGRDSGVLGHDSGLLGRDSGLFGHKSGLVAGVHASQVGHFGPGVIQPSAGLGRYQDITLQDVILAQRNRAHAPLLKAYEHSNFLENGSDRRERTNTSQVASHYGLAMTGSC